MTLLGGTLAEQARALRAREITAVELLEQSLQHIAAHEGELGAYITLTPERARAQAEAADALRARPGAAPPALCGVPVAIKDVLTVEGVPTSAGSQILRGWLPPYTATAVQRLLDQGAVVVGKTNCDEFAMGSSTENSSFGPTTNPWDTATVPGGSSGGSAATVAAGSVAIALGSDTGGSVRQPASLCGVVGMKPTYGRVSRYGLIAFASSLDQVGPLARTVEDCALVLDAIAGHDPRDSTSYPQRVPSHTEHLREGVAGMRLGVPREYFVEGIEPGVRTAVEEALGVLERAGAVLQEVSLPSTEAGLSTYYIIAPAECSSNLARFDGVRFGARHSDPSLTQTYLRTRDEGFGSEVKRRIMLGTHALSSGYYDAYYRKAQQVRTLIADEFDAAFATVDALVCPTSPTVAFRLGARADPLAMYLNDVLTIPVNLAGLPGISVPCGFSAGLPVGLQVIGPRFEDARVLRIAHAYEQATQWHTRRSPMVPAAAPA